MTLRAVREFGLWQPGDRVLLGVSGGPDSTALLAAVQELPLQWRPTVTVAYLDHGLRPGSASEAQAVAALAARLGLPCTLGAADVRAEAGRAQSLEAAARQVRYRFLADAARRAGATIVAVGHHRGDQVETVLLRLLRGGGSRGLSGMRPRRSLIAPGGAALTLVRPLWYADRADVLTYLEARGLSWAEDESNRDPARPRNRVRHQVLPALERSLGKGARAAILRAADNLAEDEAALGAWVEREGATRVVDATLDLGTGWAELPAAIRHRLVQAWWERTTGAPPLTRRMAAQVLRLPPGGRCDLPGRWRATLADGMLRLDVGTPRVAPLELPVPGGVDVRGVGRIHAEIVSLPLPPAGGGYSAVVDASDYAVPLTVRPPLPGERLRIRGADEARSIRDLLRAAGVPPAARGLPRVVADARGTILWVAGARAAGATGTRPDTRTALRLTLEPGDGR